MCIGDTIVLNTLRYPDEIRETDDLKIPSPKAKAATISAKELKMAMALVEGMSEDWKPNQYHDTYREDVLALVQKKIKAKQTKTITMPDPDEKPAKTTNVIDLVSLLQASLGKKPGKAIALDDDDDDEPPPPKRARKPADDEDEDDAPPPRRKTAAGAREQVAAKRSAARPAAKKAAAPAKKAVAARKTSTAAAPARRKKAA